MRSKSLTLILLPLLTLVYSQPDTLWTKTFGGSSDDRGSSVQQTVDGGYILTGYTRSTGSGSSDIWLIRTNSFGDTLWTQTFGGMNNDDGGSSVQQTDDGGYVLTGYTESTGSGNSDVYLIHTDNTGDTLWTKTFGGSSDDRGSSVQQTVDGGYILTGYTESFGLGSGDVWLIRTDSFGDTLWTQTFGGNFTDYGTYVRQATDGGYILTGHTGSFGSGNNDIWLIRTDSSGDTLWTKTFGGLNNEAGTSVQQTADGGYILTGHTYSFGLGSSDVWLIRTDNSGDTLWTKTFGGSNVDDGLSVSQTDDGGYILTGYTRSTGSGSSDIWLIRTNSFGDTLWTQTFGGSNSDVGYSIQQVTNGGYILTGYTESYGSGLDDVWLIRLAPESYSGPVWHVSTTGSDITGDGSETTPFASIQYGIDQSAIGDTVLVQPGIYVENINYNGKNIVVGSLFLTTQDTSYLSSTIIDGNQNGSVVTFESGEDSTASLFGFTIKNGSGTFHSDLSRYYGGGIYCKTSSPVMSFLNINSNSANEGGGVFLWGSSPRVTNININNNSATSNNGGGLLLWDHSNPRLEAIKIIDNTAWDYGGGIYLDNSDPIINNALIADNNAQSSGGLGGGGGIYCRVSTPIFLNSTITNNTAPNGAGLYCFNSSLVVINTISWNLSDNGTYEIYFQPSGSAGPSNISIANSCIQEGQNSIATNGNGNFYWLTGNIDQYPEFIDSANTNYMLSDYSPCIGAGIDSIQIDGNWHFAPTTDINDHPRPNPVGSNPDMGVYENSNSNPINVNITEIYPRSGIPGTSVIIYGTGFNPMPTENQVEFAGVPANILSASDNQIETIVPSIAPTLATVTISISALQDTSSIPFTVLSQSNRITSFLSEQIISTEMDQSYCVYSDDLDRDGDLDILSASMNDNKIAWYENLGGGTFGVQRIISTEAQLARYVYTADLDNDGDNDVLSASYLDDKIAWYENLGTEISSSQRVITLQADGAWSVHAADLNNDANIDVLSASFFDNKIAWYENNGDGTFGSQQIITTLADSAYSVYAADLDGDGDQDVLSASANDKIAWYENLGDETFGPQQIITNNADFPTSVYAADLDNDGDLDVLSSSALDDKVAWYANSGNGIFSEQPIISDFADGAYTVTAGDLNGDGFMDILSASQNDDKIAWYRNIGLQEFGTEIIVSNTADRAKSVYYADLDNDGDLDLLSASMDDDKIAWYENVQLTTIHVSITGSDNNEGSEESPFATIQHGINQSTSGDTILVEPGEYIENIYISHGGIHIASTFLITGDTTQIPNTIINGGASGSVITIDETGANPVKFTGFVVKNGWNSEGAGIHVMNNSTAVFDHLRISENQSFSAGAGFVASNYSTAFFDSCEIINNTSSTDGAGLWIQSNSNANISRSVIAYNSAVGNGGAFKIQDQASLRLDNVTIGPNEALGYGDGLDTPYYGCAFYLDQADDIEIANSILFNLTDPIFFVGGTSDTINISYSNFCDKDTIIDADTDQTYSLNIETGNINTEPGFNDYPEGDLTLISLSSCIDSGDPDLDGDGSSWETDPDDQDPDGTRMDMGAYYYHQTDVAPNIPQNLTTTPGNQQITLSWDANTESDIAKYRIYRDTSSLAMILIDSVLGAPPDTFYIDTGLINGQTYYYRITAVDSAGNQSTFSNEANSIPTTNSSFHTLYSISTVINGTQLSLSDPIIDVLAGDSITGIIDLAALSNFGTGAMVKLAGTPSWGNHSTSYWGIGGWSGSGAYYYNESIDLIAPQIDGISYIYFAFGGEQQYDEVMSLSSWACSSSPIWDDGVDVADWDDSQAQMAIDSGYVYTQYTGGDCNIYDDQRVAATAIRIRVDGPPTAPENLTATPGNQQITLRWNQNTESDLAKYRIYRDTSSPASTLIDSVVGTPPDTFYTDYGLTYGQIYYYRITAVDSGGIESVFSNEFFSTTAETGTVTDIDGNAYQTVKIGDQWWMAENLKVTHYRNGEALPNITDNSEWNNLTTGAYCNYNNDVNNSLNYGSLYNWYSVNDSRNIAPEGWHVPTDDEYKQLEMYLGMSQSDANSTGDRGTNEGSKLKETGTTHWPIPNTDATNEIGFTALPGGYRGGMGSGYYYLGFSTFFWSSTEYDISSAWDRTMSHDHSEIRRYNSEIKEKGFSVRCVKDLVSAPQNLSATPGNQQVILRWNANSEPDIAKYRIYCDNSSPATALIDSVVGAPPDTFYTNIGLTNVQTYYYRITAVDSAGNKSGYSNEVSAIPVSSNQDHLVFKEVVLQPSTGEYLKITNPSIYTIDLSDYYITDGTDIGNGEYYYNLPTDLNFWSGSGFDFIVRFPDGCQLTAGQTITVAMVDSATYQSEYGIAPDLSIKEDFRSAGSSGITIGGAPFFLDNTHETLILFQWDGSSSEVQDVDYLLWGDNSYAIDKTGIGNYLPDTPVGAQSFMPIHFDGEKLIRVSDEGSEIQTGGNGITGHDETSENLAQTWNVTNLVSARPVISNLSVTPNNPTSNDEINFSATVTDDGNVVLVEFIYTFADDTNTVEMADVGSDIFTTTLQPMHSAGMLTYYVRAVDNFGLKDSTNVYYFIIEMAYSDSIWHISTNGSDSNDGSSLSPFATIQHGIDVAGDGDTVLVQPGTYVENINFNGKNIVVKGEERETTIIDGNYAGRVVTFMGGEDSTAVLCDLTLTRGRSAPGGGIHCDESSPTLNNLYVIDNSASGWGGGISFNGCSATLNNSTIINNVAETDGGGIIIYNNSDITITNTNINTNFASYNLTGTDYSGDGGGIALKNEGKLNINNAIIYGNTTDDGVGGGIYFSGAEFQINNCTITENSSYQGAGIYLNLDNNTDFSNSIVENTIIRNNTTNTPSGHGYGGGIYVGNSSVNQDSLLHFNNIEITNNTSGEGGGLYFNNINIHTANSTIVRNTSTYEWGGGICSSGGNHVLLNTILWNNVPQEIFFRDQSHSSYNVIDISYSNIQGDTTNIATNDNGEVNWLDGNINENPIFIDPDNSDFHLQWGSPCIDTGDPQSPLDPDGTRADMGAFYYDQTDTIPPTIIITSPTMVSQFGTEDTLLIEWNADDSRFLSWAKIYFSYSDSYPFEFLDSLEASTEHFEWLVPDTVISTECRVKIEISDHRGNLTADTSDYFTIYDNTSPIVNIIALGEGFSIPEHEYLNIEWNASDNVLIDLFEVYFYDVNGIWSTSGVPISGDSSSTGLWIPAGVFDSARVMISAVDTSGNSGQDISHYFSITDNTPPTVSLLTPTAGEKLGIGSGLKITWLAEDNVFVSGVDLFYSTNNGSSWSTISGSEINDGVYDWIVPNEPSNQVGLRLVVEDAVSLKDTIEVMEMSINIEYPTVINITPDPSENLSWLGRDSGVLIQFSQPILEPIDKDSVIITCASRTILSPYFATIVADSILWLWILDGFPTSDTISIELKSRGFTNIYGYELDGNDDGVPGDDYKIDFTTTMLADYDTSNAIDVLDLAQFIQALEEDNYYYELGPVSGTAPSFITKTDSTFNIEDVMAFVMMWNWYVTTSGPSFQTFTDAGTPLTVEATADSIIIEIPDGALVYEVQIKYDPLTLMIGDLKSSSDIRLSNLNEEGGIYRFMTGTTSENKVRVPISILGKKTDLAMSFRAAGHDSRIISQMTKEIQIINIPIEFALHQNYPNPFNPLTTIEYDLPEDRYVNLVIYDILGRQVIQITNEFQEAGYKSIRWNGRNTSGQVVSAGMYFYAIEAGKNSAIRKMVLLK